MSAVLGHVVNCLMVVLGVLIAVMSVLDWVVPLALVIIVGGWVVR